MSIDCGFAGTLVLNDIDKFIIRLDGNIIKVDKVIRDCKSMWTVVNLPEHLSSYELQKIANILQWLDALEGNLND